MQNAKILTQTTKTVPLNPCKPVGRAVLQGGTAIYSGLSRLLVSKSQSHINSTCSPYSFVFVCLFFLKVCNPFKFAQRNISKKQTNKQKQQLYCCHNPMGLGINIIAFNARALFVVKKIHQWPPAEHPQHEHASHCSQAYPDCLPEAFSGSYLDRRSSSCTENCQTFPDEKFLSLPPASLLSPAVPHRIFVFFPLQSNCR